MICVGWYEKGIEQLGLKCLDDDIVSDRIRYSYIDNDGYKYLVTKVEIGKACYRNGKLSRFFRDNPYTEYNFQVLLNLQYDGIIKIVDFNDAKNAQDKIKLYNEVQDFEYYATCNKIQTGKAYMKTKDSDWESPRKHSNKDFLAKLSDSPNEYVDIIGEYKLFKYKIKCKCKKCGEILYLNPNTILKNGGHRKCNVSLGENRISKWLRLHNINFISQHTFPDCKYKSRLRFDFYLPKQNICIEYDGMQHFESRDWFGGEEVYNIQIEKDNIKNQYCMDNKIKLYRIPYWDFDNIDTILNDIKDEFEVF